jgi:hypothetical protein
MSSSERKSKSACHLKLNFLGHTGTCDHMKGKSKDPVRAASWTRLVSRMPVEELWSMAGSTRHLRLRSLTTDDVEPLLKAFPDLRLVEARIGEELRWYPHGDYGFWYHRAQLHAAEPDNRRSLDEFPDSMCYFVSEWVEAESQDRVLLFEQHH